MAECCFPSTVTDQLISPARLTDSSLIPVSGLYLPEPNLWLDPHTARPFAVITHAHADHVAAHETVICTKPCSALLRKRFSHKGNHIALDHRESYEHAGHLIQLLPAGHVLGSAMVHVTRLSDGASLLYTGDFKLRAAPTSEPAEPIPADTLIMETTFGQPHYVFPPYEELRDRVIRWCRDALDNGETPILLGYSLGKAQEIMHLLHGENLPLAVHETIFSMCQVYEELGVTFPAYSKFQGPQDAGKVIVLPPQMVRNQQIRRMKRTVTAMLSGWGMNAGAKFQSQTDEVFPLSDHADYPDLMRLVEIVKPQLVLTTHGYAAEFARDFRQRSHHAWSLQGRDQLELSLVQETEPALLASSASEPMAPTTPFQRFAHLCDQVGTASGRIKKVAMLAKYFVLLSPTELPLAAWFLAGRPAATRAQLQQMQTGWAIIRLALLEVTGLTMADYRRISQQQNDAGRTTQVVLEQARSVFDPGVHSLESIQQQFDLLREARGPLQKTSVLKSIFLSMTPDEARYVVKILTGDTRIGLKEGLLEEALAAAFEQEPELVREAHMLTGDMGQAAILTRQRELASAALVPFQPIKVMLASPKDSAEEIWEKLGFHGRVWLEDKFDGIRAQLHKLGKDVSLYSRDLRSLNLEFPDLVSPASTLDADVVFDGEIIAFQAGRKLSFFDLQQRLGRRAVEADLFLTEHIPVRYVIFDLLWLNGKSLLKEPLAERRRLLESLRLHRPFEKIALHSAGSIEEIETAFARARAAGNEGLIAKDSESIYASGRRGSAWLKLKKSNLSLDVVVVKAEQGHGKRSHLLSDYTFAVRDTKDGSLKVIGKAYSGLTDLEMEELTEHFKATTLSTKRTVHTVTPEIVLEIAFDGIQPSKRHESGLALRFPRIKAIRRDKTPAEIDTLDHAWKLADSLNPSAWHSKIPHQQ